MKKQITQNHIKKGSGYPLILLHGNGEDSTYFKNQIEAFAPNFTVYALDSRAHGKTKRGDGELTLKRLSDDLLNFMNDQKIEKANILGYSDGANVATLFALEQQDRINKLILNGGNVKQNGIKTCFNITMTIEFALLKLAGKFSTSAKQKCEIISLMIGQPNLNGEDLSKITVPTLVIVGTKDVIKQSHTDFMHESIKMSELKIIDGGHAVASENPKEFNRAVLEFLNK